jgi:hypothetical protein
MSIEVRQENVVIQGNGNVRVKHSCKHIHCVYVAKAKVNTGRPKWWIISNHIEAINNCFGIKRTGKGYVNTIMIRRQQEANRGRGYKSSAH